MTRLSKLDRSDPPADQSVSLPDADLSTPATVHPAGSPHPAGRLGGHGAGVDIYPVRVRELLRRAA